MFLVPPDKVFSFFIGKFGKKGEEKPCFMSPKLKKFAYKWYFCNSAAPSICIFKFIPVSNGVISINTSKCRYQKVSIKS